MTLDYPSILFFLALNNLFIITLFIYQYFYHHKRWYLLVFILGIAFQTISIILFSNRDILPPLYTLRINNLLVISSFALTSFGLVSFDGKIRKNLLWIFCVFVCLFYASILVVEENYTIVNVIRIIACSFFYCIGAFYLFRNKYKYKFSILISGVLLIFSIFQIIRAFSIYQIGQSYDFTKSSAIDNLFFMITIFVISASSIGFIMLLKEINQKEILRKNIIIQQDKFKLEELNLTQNKLFSIIAHDLRNPFNNILGLSELLIENMENIEVSESQKYLGLMNSSTKNTLILLDNLLNWSKSQTGQLQLNLEKIILSEVIQEIIESMNMFLTVKNISLNNSLSDKFEVYTDKNIISTVFRNLISNAIKFTKPGGNVSVLIKREQSQVEFTVSDNGVGMNEEAINKLFKIGTNATSNGTANEKGSGLGLTLCKELLDKLGGKIWVESEEGIGSDFKFTLPLVKQE